jgi:hypothetical protein
MSRFDEQPDGDLHGECAAAIHELQAKARHLKSTADEYRYRWIYAEDCRKCLSLAAQKAMDECFDLLETPAGNALEAALQGSKTHSELMDAHIEEIILRVVYDGDDSVPYRKQWTADVGLSLARAIELAVRGRGPTTLEGRE